MLLRRWNVVLLWMGLMVGAAAVAEHHEETGAPPGLDASLDGVQIYQRVLDNNLRTSYMEQRFISTDASGDSQELRFWARFKDYRSEGRPAEDGTISKTSMKFTYPRDKRDAGYLFIEFYQRENDGFNYSRFRDKVMRVNTSRETIFGTDFTLEDLAMVRVIDDATYARQPDEVIQDVPVYVVEITYKPEAYAQYARSIVYVDPRTYVPLLTRHWNDEGVETKNLEAPLQMIELHDGAYIPMEATMFDLREETKSVLYTDKVEPNVELDDRLFQPKRLAKNRR